MAIFTVTIAGVTNPIEVYGGLPALSDYLGGAAGDGAAAFRALASSTDDQKRLLVDATRYIDAQGWQGLATGLAGGTVTTLQFPRTGLTKLDGTVLDATNVPTDLINAVFEMVRVLASDTEAQAAVDSGSNLSSMGAGSGRLSFFRPTSAQSGNATVLPTAVNRLVGRWLAAASAAVAAAFAGVATGVNPCSDFSTCCSSCNSTTCCCASRVRDVSWPL